MENKKVEKVLTKMIKYHGSNELLEVLNAKDYEIINLKHDCQDENVETTKAKASIIMGTSGFYLLLLALGIPLTGQILEFLLIPLILFVPFNIFGIKLCNYDINLNFDKFITMFETYGKKDIKEKLKAYVKKEYETLKEKGNLKKLENFKEKNSSILKELQNDNNPKPTSLKVEENKIKTTKIKHFTKSYDNTEENTNTKQ